MLPRSLNLLKENIMARYTTAATFFVNPFGTMSEDFDFESEEIPDLCAIATMFPLGTRMSLSVWDINSNADAIWMVDELDVGFEFGFEPR